MFLGEPCVFIWPIKINKSALLAAILAWRGQAGSVRATPPTTQARRGWPAEWGPPLLCSASPRWKFPLAICSRLDVSLRFAAAHLAVQHWFMVHMASRGGKKCTTRWGREAAAGIPSEAALLMHSMDRSKTAQVFHWSFLEEEVLTIYDRLCWFAKATVQRIDPVPRWMKKTARSRKKILGKLKRCEAKNGGTYMQK